MKLATTDGSLVHLMPNSMTNQNALLKLGAYLFISHTEELHVQID
jgi:hypothetical protein